MIPLSLYGPLWHHILLGVVIITALLLWQGKRWGWFLMVVLSIPTTFYMGLRPISARYFMDMAVYAYDFKRMQLGWPGWPYGKKEWFFKVFMQSSALCMSVETWFFICAALYIGLIAWAFFRKHGSNGGLALLFSIGSLSFWGYGTNGIRNGLATSLLLLAFSFHKNLLVMGLLLALSIGTHISSALPVAAFLATYVIHSSRFYLSIYALCIALSLTMGSWWENFFANSGLMSDQRFTSYLLGSKQLIQESFSSAGFRWDFLAYSSWPILTGMWYIFRRGFQDKLYKQLFHTYILCNAFWVLIIRAGFSNRFAYLSWFLMPWVIIYPLLECEEDESPGLLTRNRIIALALLAYYGFTYFMVLKTGAKNT